jgi:hypothetical protein
VPSGAPIGSWTGRKADSATSRRTLLALGVIGIVLITLLYLLGSLYVLFGL